MHFVETTKICENEWKFFHTNIQETNINTHAAHTGKLHNYY